MLKTFLRPSTLALSLDPSKNLLEVFYEFIRLPKNVKYIGTGIRFAQNCKIVITSRTKTGKYQLMLNH